MIALMNDLEQRLDRLERSNRRYRFGLAVCLGLLVVLVTAGFATQLPEPRPQEPEVQDTIKARNIQLIGANDVPIVELSDINGNGAVTTFNREGDILVLLGITTTNHGAVATFDGDGGLLVETGANSEGGGRIRTFDAEGQRTASLPAR
jgi:hypothetical protein